MFSDISAIILKPLMASVHHIDLVVLTILSIVVVVR